MRRLLAVLGLAACGATAASAQDEAGEAFASYALDFCVAVVEGQSLEAAEAAVSPAAQLVGPQPLGDDPTITDDLEGERDTPIYVLSPTDASASKATAFARADATHCVTFSGPGEDSFDALLRRVSEDARPWQEQQASDGLDAFQRNIRGGSSSVVMYVIHDERDPPARVIVQRLPFPMRLLTDEQIRPWARVIVSECAASIHWNLPLAENSLEPFFVPRDVQDPDALALDAPRGQIGGTIYANTDDGEACSLVFSDLGMSRLGRALIDHVLAAGGEQQADGNYRVPKPRDAPGRDAIFRIDFARGPLWANVYPG